MPTAGKRPIPRPADPPGWDAPPVSGDVLTQALGLDDPQEALSATLTPAESEPDPDTQEAAAEALAATTALSTTALVRAWHADDVALGFVHAGGGCGCRYLAGVALGALA